MDDINLKDLESMIDEFRELRKHTSQYCNEIYIHEKALVDLKANTEANESRISELKKENADLKRDVSKLSDWLTSRLTTERNRAERLCSKIEELEKEVERSTARLDSTKLLLDQETKYNEELKTAKTIIEVL
jgi:phosphatidate phosphatase PAH1